MHTVSFTPSAQLKLSSKSNKRKTVAYTWACLFSVHYSCLGVWLWYSVLCLSSLPFFVYDGVFSWIFFVLFILNRETIVLCSVFFVVPLKCNEIIIFHQTLPIISVCTCILLKNYKSWPNPPQTRPPHFSMTWHSGWKTTNIVCHLYVW